MSQLQISNKLKTNTSLAKPFLKWAGGKTQLLEQFEKLYPKELKLGKINKYFEIFLGGGAVFFNIIQKYSVDKVFLNDINQDLILAYKVIKNNPDDLIEFLSELQQNYHQSDPEQREKIFYNIRQNYNAKRIDFNYSDLSQCSIERVSWLIFINKTCFNGLYRTNKKGEFNVPFGRYKKPKICDDSNLVKVSRLLQDVMLISGNYNSFDNLIDSNSFIYIDPPYRPINKTSSFTSYAKSGFSDRHQIELSQYYRHLSQDYEAKVMLSNSNPHNTDLEDNFFHDLYGDYKINEVFASRMVNSDASKRGKITELVITNY
ncbi:Modification methylase MjaIII [Hyella patelloides LEGE 07179]|uniref:Site-specific DNA-methyltransferase (adenine-specific) n=1 Tax=Hyella patelloides LEGE 07179 TaxID=945734 RepID=A0A563W523_9CYAN|nr:DNA adenine methylase [Hyella patelloides]VEP18778.1 Modification methylase MjaIII [Hyella patelloides LEGE 07179]